MRTDTGISSTRVYFSIFFIAFVMPVIIFSTGYRYLSKITMELEDTLFLSQSEPLIPSLEVSLSNGRFWCNQLNEVFLAGADIKEFQKSVELLSEKHGQKLKYIIWQFASSSFCSNFLGNDKHARWQKTGRILKSILDIPGFKPDLRDDFFLKKMIGPHLQSTRLYEAKRKLKFGLIESDFSLKHPLVWVNSREEFTSMVLLPPSILKKTQGVRFFFQQLVVNRKNNDEYALLNGDKLCSSSNISVEKLAEIRSRFLITGKRVLRFRQGLYFGEQLSDGSFFIAFRADRSLWAAKIEGLFVLIWFFMLLLAFRTFSLSGLADGLKINTAIYYFIGLSNILPLCLLLIFTRQYLAQKYLVLIDDKRAESVKFIQLLEQEYQNEIERFPGKVLSVIDSFKADIKEHSLNYRIADQINKTLVKNRVSFYFIASTSGQLFSNTGLFRDNKFVALGTEKKALELNRLDELLMKIGGCYLSFWNKTPVSQKTLTETELIAEMMFGKPIDEAMHLFVEINHKIGLLGFGANSSLSFIDIVSLSNPEKADYMGLYQLNQENRAVDFLMSKKRERLANSYGIKVAFARGLVGNKERIAPFKDLDSLLPVFFKLSDYPPLSVIIISIEGRDWICSGYNGTVIKGSGIIALYPLDEIQKRLNDERNDLLLLFALNLLIVLAISFFFSHMLLGPVKWLEEGTRAINSRNFTYRLPDLGNDEMGRMASIFNEAVADLEEMSVARVVQQQLFPQGKIDTGAFDLFGRSITLVDLGGDYLDYFEIDAENFAAILGDVAGHGVGAAMIMAMAKSAILNSSAYFRAPAELLLRLHNLIYSTKTRKQKKIMTFQYLVVNKIAHTAVLSNAGGCNPFLVNGVTGKIAELSLPAAALGAFKKGSYKEMEIRFEPGDTLVFYTDGIVEARNPAGEEIGYERFQNLLLKNWSANSEEFYNSMLSDYKDWLGATEPQDDMTMMIIGLTSSSV
ncbi:MAG: SpoIIE family protein phosphatase [Candidatus Riflebacteria bacterium]|nr:SpoIIE family protein phosphatase [Candidatus Riflebacteria bacterium]